MSSVFIASTLPALILKIKINEWSVTEIIISNKRLLNTYEYLLNSLNINHIKIICVPSNFLTGFAFIFFKLLKNKIFKKKIFFFHECCWLTFDLLINFLNNTAEYFPQVSMKGFEEKKIKFLSKELILISLFRQNIKYKSYELVNDNNSGSGIVWSCIKYNKNVLVHTLLESVQIKSLKNNSKLLVKSKKCLFLIGTDMVSSKNLISVYMKLASILDKEKYKVYIKDHPNVDNQLDRNGKLKGTIIPSFIPIELIEDDFEIVIGSTSTGLVSFKDRAFSILHCLKMSEKNILIRKKHLLNLPGGKDIFFIKDTDVKFSAIKERIKHNKIH